MTDGAFLARAALHHVLSGREEIEVVAVRSDRAGCLEAVEQLLFHAAQHRGPILRIRSRG